MRARGRGPAFTRWDRVLAGRAAALAGIGGLVTLVIVATTDEGAPWSRRLGMVAALLPIASALATGATIRIAHARGELRALLALGVDPVRVVRGAVVGGVALALLGPACALEGLADLSGLFPRPVAALVWERAGEGMRELTQGIVVGPGGALARQAPTGALASSVPEGAPTFTAAALALAALGAPLWVAAPALGARRVITGIAATLLAVLAFQAVAAGRVLPAALLAAPLIVLIDAAWARYRARKSA